MAVLTIALMNGPYESETTTTVLRIADAAIRKGHKINIFAYEGAVNLTSRDQASHPNPVKGTSALYEEDHPSTARFIRGLFETDADAIDWINCGVCADERGTINWIDGVRKGSPADLFQWFEESDNTLIIGAK